MRPSTYLFFLMFIAIGYIEFAVGKYDPDVLIGGSVWIVTGFGYLFYETMKGIESAIRSGKHE